jgi:hypothetical protein
MNFPSLKQLNFIKKERVSGKATRNSNQWKQSMQQVGAIIQTETSKAPQPTKERASR